MIRGCTPLTHTHPESAVKYLRAVALRFSREAESWMLLEETFTNVFIFILYSTTVSQWLTTEMARSGARELSTADGYGRIGMDASV